MGTVHAVLPASVHDPRRPSGGNTYDRELCTALGGLGWRVVEHLAPGAWPAAVDADVGHLLGQLRGLPDDALVLVDGLIGSAAPGALGAEAERLRFVVLVHQPLGVLPGPDASTVRSREARALSAAVAVVATSNWTRDWLVATYDLPPSDIHVAEPGVAPAPQAPGTAAGGELLYVGSVTAAKGADTLVRALSDLSDLRWRAVLAGGLDVDRGFVERLRAEVGARALEDRVHLAGPLDARRLEAAYAAADLVVLPSRAETYGMVVTEALARALPVVASEVGGVPEALGHAPDGGRPGVLVPAGDARELGRVLRSWLVDPQARQVLRRRAAGRRTRLTTWARPARLVSDILGEPRSIGVRMQQGKG